MQPEDIIRIWNEEEAADQRRRDNLVAVLVALSLCAGVALLAWWGKV